MVLWEVGLGFFFGLKLFVSPSPFQRLSQGVLQDFWGTTRMSEMGGPGRYCPQRGNSRCLLATTPGRQEGIGSQFQGLWWAEGAATTSSLPSSNFTSYSLPLPQTYPFLGATLNTRVRFLATVLAWLYDLDKSLSLTVSPFLYLKWG